MVTHSSSSSKQEQKSLTNADDSFLSASGGSGVIKVSQVDGPSDITVNGVPGNEVANIVNALAGAAGNVIDGVNQTVAKQSDQIASIATTATGTQTELDRIVNKLIVPSFLLIGGVVALGFYGRSK